MLVRKKRELARRHAFTLTEMVVVVSIIVVLAGIGGGYAYKVYDESRESAAKMKAVTIQRAAESWRIKNGSDDEVPPIQVLTQPDESNKSYLTLEDITDPWGKQSYQIEHGTNGKLRVFTMHGQKKISSHE